MRCAFALLALVSVAVCGSVDYWSLRYNEGPYYGSCMILEVSPSDLSGNVTGVKAPYNTLQYGDGIQLLKASVTNGVGFGTWEDFFYDPNGSPPVYVCSYQAAVTVTNSTSFEISTVIQSSQGCYSDAAEGTLVLTRIHDLFRCSSQSEEQDGLVKVASRKTLGGPWNPSGWYAATSTDPANPFCTVIPVVQSQDYSNQYLGYMPAYLVSSTSLFSVKADGGNGLVAIGTGIIPSAAQNCQSANVVLKGSSSGNVTLIMSSVQCQGVISSFTLTPIPDRSALCH
jgi:hypothetical protein